MTASVAHTFYDRLSEWWLRHDFCDPAGVFTMEATFVEAYCVRAALRRLDFLGGKTGHEPAIKTTVRDALVRSDVTADEECTRLQQAVVTYCDRVVEHQGVQGPPPALFMGYGLKVANGFVQHSCVADQSSVASAVVETIRAFPGHPHAPRWQECIERWAGWVIENFARPNGGIGVGILSHEWNPIPEYWCATSLFAESLFRLSMVSKCDDYARVGLKSLDWLSRLDFRAVEIPRFDECPCEVILYAASGMIAGLEHLARERGAAAACAHPVWSKLTEMLTWLVDNQQPDGNWPVPAGRGYRAYSLGLPWILTRAQQLENSTDWQPCAGRFLQFASSPSGEQYFGLFVRPWAMSLAWLSAGETIMR